MQREIVHLWIFQVRTNRVSCTTAVAAAADEGDLAARDAEDDGPPVVDGDWRAFRSRLLAGSGAGAARVAGKWL
jgi:hypothetical protein